MGAGFGTVCGFRRGRGAGGGAGARAAPGRGTVGGRGCGCQDRVTVLDSEPVAPVVSVTVSVMV
ncbi:hypothetical protein GCM10026982_08610 [Nocardiopsis aegyptia]